MIIDAKRLDSILNNIKNKKILVIGDIMLDRYIWGDCNRISPEAPVPVINVKGETSRLGGAANVAANLSKLGATPYILSISGFDDTDILLRNILKESYISDEFILKVEDRPTTVKTRVIAQNQQIVRVDREISSDIDMLIQNKLLSSLKSIISSIDGIIVSDYGKGIITEDFIENIQKIANEHNCFISVDPKEKHFNIYHNISLITPNTLETSYAVGFSVSDDESVEKAGNYLLDSLKCKAVLITRGAKGMSLFDNEGKKDHFPTLAKKVFDVTGAGDTVISVATASYIAGASMREAAIISNHAAGVSVAELGTKSVSIEEIVTSMNRERELNGNS